MQTVKNEVIPFDFDTHQVRTILIDDQPYFLTKDICEILGLSEPKNVVRHLHESQKLRRVLYASGQQRQYLLINESGLYALLFKSRKAEAQKFQLWVTNEVLPSIRKTGSYNADRVLNPVSVRETQMELNLQPTETIRVLPNELYEELMTIESKAKRMKLMKLYKAIAAKGQVV